MKSIDYKQDEKKGFPSGHSTRQKEADLEGVCHNNTIFMGPLATSNNN